MGASARPIKYDNPLDPNSPMETWIYKALLFGAISLLILFILSAILGTLIGNSGLPPDIKDTHKRGIYVDDLFHATNDERGLIQFYSESHGLLEEAGFRLRWWN